MPKSPPYDKQFEICHVKVMIGNLPSLNLLFFDGFFTFIFHLLLMFLEDVCMLNKSPKMVLSREPPGLFCDAVCYCYFILIGGFYVSRLLFHATDTPLWFLRPVNVSSSSELYPGYFLLLYFARIFLHILSRALRF